MTAAPIVLVLGPHRSGTSATTRFLSLAGCSLPPDLMAPHPDNPTGYWEPQSLVALHDAVLDALGSNWSDPRPLPTRWFEHPDIERVAGDVGAGLRDDAAGPLAIKDPRLCRLLPMWARVLEHAGRPAVAVCVARPAREVIASLVQRDGFSPAWAALIWLRHVVELEAGSRTLPRVVVQYPGLLADWRAVLPRIAALPGLEGLSGDGAAGDAITSFLDRGLRRQSGDGVLDALPDPLARAVTACETAYGDLAAADDATVATAASTLDDLDAWLRSVDALIGVGVEAGLRDGADDLAAHEHRAAVRLDEAEQRAAAALQARDQEIAALRHQLGLVQAQRPLTDLPTAG